MKKYNDLTVNEIARVKKIFSDKCWPEHDSFDEDILDNFCKLLRSMSAEQRDLILLLTEDFLWVRQCMYMKCFEDAFHQFISSLIKKNTKTIVVCPLLAKKDYNSACKSSQILQYLIKPHTYAIKRKYQEYEIIFIDNPENKYIDKVKNNDKYVLCLIDDFIGTGDTAESAIKFFFDKDINPNKINIVTLVILEDGINRLSKNGYSVYYSKKCYKGLSSKKNDRYIEIMRNIEEIIKVPDNFKFGYKNSEALVRMIRTPNNTFPIYWLKNEYNPNAPFKR